MAFPASVLGIKVEFLIAGVWTNVTSDVQGNTFRMEISRGQYSESPVQVPGQCAFVLKNPSNKYSTRIPGTTYYGVLKRNIRMRVSITDPTLSNVYRFHGEIPSWPLRADSTGNYRSIPIVAMGLLSRLSQGQRALRSVAYRTLITADSQADALIYVPFEEESNATSYEVILSGTSVTSAGYITVTPSVSFGAHTSHPASQRMPTFGTAGTILIKAPSHTSTGQYKFVGVWNIPSSPADGARIYRHYFSGGTLGFIEVWVRDNTDATPEEVQCWFYQNTTSGYTAFNTAGVGASGVLWGGEVTISIELTQTGPNLFCTVLVVGQTSSSIVSNSPVGAITMGTWTQTLVSPRDFFGDFPTDGVGADSCSLGHFIVGNDTTAFADFISPNVNGVLGTRAFTGETAAARMTRLFGEEDIGFTLIGNASDTERVGSQRVATLLELIQDCAIVDRGLLYESREAFELVYRTRRSLYNSAPATTLRYASPYNHLGPELLQPADDDQFFWNYVVVSRSGGSQSTSVQRSGPVNVNSPDSDPDGVNTYDRGPVTLYSYLDSQSRRIAPWIKHLGTVDQLRYPDIPVHLSRAPFVSAAGAAALTSGVGALDIGTAVTVDSMPAWLPGESTRQQVRGYHETLTNKEWEIHFNAVPDWPYEVWVVETGGSTLTTAVTSSDTSWRLATSLGPEWNTTRVPYYIQGGGEAVKVTAMATQTPTHVSAGTVAHADNASVVPGLPAGIAVGDLMILMATIRNSGTGTPNAPTGWAPLAGSANMQFYYRYYVSGDTAPTVTFTGGVAGATCSARIAGYTNLSHNFAGGTRLVPTYTEQLNGSSDPIAYPAHNQQRNGGVEFIAGWKQAAHTGVNAVSGFTEAFDSFTSTGSGQSLFLQHRIYTTAANRAAGSVTATGGISAINRGIVFALRPIQVATVTRNQNNTSVSVAAASAVKAWRQGVNGL